MGVYTSITHYCTRTAIVTVEHDFPPGTALKAEVDVNLLLETMKSFETRIGEWIHVIGYLKSHRDDVSQLRINPQIQAIFLWTAGPLRLDEYERTIQVMQEV